MNRREREHVAAARHLIAQFNTDADPDCLWYADEHLRVLEGLPRRRHPLEGVRAVPITEVSSGPGREFRMRTTFEAGGVVDGRSRTHICIHCGRANIYHEPKTGLCPENAGDPWLAPKVD